MYFRIKLKQFYLISYRNAAISIVNNDVSRNMIFLFLNKERCVRSRISNWIFIINYKISRYISVIIQDVLTTKLFASRVAHSKTNSSL